ncbi:MAG: ParB/RepB/Spo0J family partition protein [Cellulomonadaceae bacterium]|jgi:ParB family chromosome partitioning protein|nr:ParB/RepB/Spo0J family partition protein [Cellulomonadaceae bacterium]
MVTRTTGLGRGIASLIPSGPGAGPNQNHSLHAVADPADGPDNGPEGDRGANQSNSISHFDRSAPAQLVKSSALVNLPRHDDNPLLNAAIARHPSAPPATVTELHPVKEPVEKPRKRPVDVFFEDKAEVIASRQAWDAADADGRIGLASSGRDDQGADNEDKLLPVPGVRYAELIIDMIEPNAKQPRKVFGEEELAELTSSISEIGLLQPIVVRERRGGYELIMGERRWRAAQRAGLRKIPAIIRDTDDAAMLRDALLENLHRANLDPLEEATAYRQLLDDFGCTQEELAARIFRSRPQITNSMRLLKLPPLIQRRLAKGDLSAGHARAILGLKDVAEMERLAQRIVAEGLSVRTVEELVLAADEQRPPRQIGPRSARTPATDQLAVRLTERFGAKVQVRIGQVGKVTIEFEDMSKLNHILALIAPDDPGIAEAA